MGYVVQKGDNIWDIAERTLIMETRNPQPPVMDVARRMQEIISHNLPKLKGGSPGAADLIYSGMELDIPGFGAPTPSAAINNGKKAPAPGGGPARAAEDLGDGKGTPGGGAARAAEDFGPGTAPNSAPTGGREPGWGGRPPARPPGYSMRDGQLYAPGGRQVTYAPGTPRPNSAPTGGREPGWGSPGGGVRPNSASTGGREPGWGGRLTGTPGGGPARAAADFGRGGRTAPGSSPGSMNYEPWAGQGVSAAARDKAQGFGPRAAPGRIPRSGPTPRPPGGALSWQANRF